MGIAKIKKDPFRMALIATIKEIKEAKNAVVYQLNDFPIYKVIWDGKSFVFTYYSIGPKIIFRKIKDLNTYNFNNLVCSGSEVVSDMLNSIKRTL